MSVGQDEFDSAGILDRLNNTNAVVDRMCVEVLRRRVMEAALQDNIRDLIARLVSAEASLMAAYRDFDVLKSSLDQLTRYTVDDSTMVPWGDGEYLRRSDLEMLLESFKR